jgi:hypothetical protein
MTCFQVKEPSDLGTVCSRVQRQGFATLQQVIAPPVYLRTRIPYTSAVGARYRPHLG